LVGPEEGEFRQVDPLLTGFAAPQGNHSEFGYFLLGGQAHYSIHATNGGGQYGVLTARQAGDFGLWKFELTDRAKTLAAGERVEETHKIIIEDGRGHASVRNVTIVIAGKNDTPTIKSNGGGATADVDVSENVTAITTVRGKDVDRHSGLNYSIVGGLDESKFVIDEDTGKLTFIAGHDFETPNDSNTDNVYQVIVKVKDGHGASDTQTINVHVKDAAGTLSFDFAAGAQSSDVALVARFVGGGALVKVDWGDGNDNSSAVAAGGTNNFNFTHSYAAGFDGQATVTALDGATPVGAAQQFHVQTAVVGGSTLTGDAARDVLIGNAGIDTLDGGDNDDLLKGGANNDRLTGGNGDDLLVGGAGADTFAFAAGFGDDVVTDFSATTDFLEFSNAVFANAAAVIAATTENADGDAVITKGSDTIVLEGVSKDDLILNLSHLLFV
jgi:VCBS repeat-containing protein